MIYEIYYFSTVIFITLRLNMVNLFESAYLIYSQKYLYMCLHNNYINLFKYSLKLRGLYLNILKRLNTEPQET